MKNRIILLIICLFFINSVSIAAQIRKKEGYLSDSKEKNKTVTTYYLVDSAGRKISTQEYDYLDEVNENLFIAKDGIKYGLIDGKGKSLVPFEYQEIKWLKYNVLRFKYNNKFGLMTFSGGLILPANYTYLEKIDDRVLKYNNNSDNKVEGVSGNNSITLIGLMDYQGNIITEPKYSYIDKIDNYLLRVIMSASKEEGNSQQALPPGIVSPTAGSEQARQYVTGKYGLIDYSGKVVLTPQYDYLNKINNTILQVKKGQSWGRVEYYHGNILNVMMDYQSYW